MSNLRSLVGKSYGRGSLAFNKNETLDDLEQDRLFQERSERFLTSVGEKSDDIFEYLRDSDYNLYSGFKRASESKLFTPQQKADYKYLRQRFDRADTGSLKQYLGAARDIGIDFVTDPTLLAATLTTPITGGATLAARAALAKGASTGLKQLAKTQTKKAIGVTAAEAGAWTGLDNYFRQETEVNTDIRKLFSTPELIGSAALGTVLGGLLGAGSQKLAVAHSKKIDLFTDDEYLEQVGSMAAYRLGTRKDKIIARTIGKPTAILNTMAEISPVADALRKLIRYDAGKEFFNRTNKPLEFSFGENINWRTGNYKLMYEQAISPLYTKQNGIMTDQQQKEVIKVLRGGKSDNAAINKVSDNLKKFYDTIFNHAVKNKLISPERRVENYFPISWNRKAIKENPEKFKELLLKEDGVSLDNVDKIIAGVLDEKNAAYGETANILTGMRGLNIKDENVFEDFLINDLHAVSHSYYAKAARNIETKKAFGSRDKNTGELILTRASALEEFEKQWVDPLNQELIAKGVKGGLTKTERNNVVNLFKTLTGDLNYYQSDVGQSIYDTLKLSQQVAHLPLATLSSMSEVFIPLTKGKPERYTQELLKSMGEAGELFTKKIPRILKDKHNLDQPEVFNEMNKVFLAVEEALADRVENLAGEGMQTEWVKKGARGFFKANLLTQWTKMVQLASFNIGKDLIRSNLKELHKASKAGTDIFKATGKLRRYKEELFDLGIDIEQGIKWVDDGAKQADARKAYSELTDSEKFYQVNLIRGAGRFVNEVILNPAREQAIKPIIQSNPKVDILFQFLGYPTAFSNTVLKNYARQVILNPAANAPKILSATLLMTGTALGLNYVRGSDESREEYFKDPQKTIQKAIQRVGLLGPLEHGVRFSDSLEYSKNPALSLLTLGGPILDDTLGSVFYRRGLSETIAKNLPGYASKNVLENLTGLTPYDNITEGARKLDKSLKESMFGKPLERSRYERDYKRSYRRNYQEGGLVSDMLFGDDMIDPYTTQVDKDNPVLNVADDPTKRTNPYTGTSYSEGTRPSVVATLQKRRLATGGEVRQRYATGLLAKGVRSTIGKAFKNYFKTRTDDIDTKLAGVDLTPETLSLDETVVNVRKDALKDAFETERKQIKSARKTKHPLIQEKYNEYEQGNTTYTDYHNFVMNEKDDLGQRLFSPRVLKNVPELVDPIDIATIVRGFNNNPRIIGVNELIKDGEEIGLRLDINAYEDYNKYIVSLHGRFINDKFKKDMIRGYANTGYITDVNFTSSRTRTKQLHDRGTKGVKESIPKSTYGKMRGKWKNHTPEELASLARKAMNDPDWIQVGFNPDKFSYFYNKATGNPLKSAEEVIQVGALVLARNPEELPIDDIINKTGVYPKNLEWIKDNLFDKENLLFNKGGLVNRLQQRNMYG